jgi:two-component system, sensor histidine kinase
MNRVPTKSDKCKLATRNAPDLNPEKFTDEGTVRISVARLPDSNRVEFHVADTGIGTLKDKLLIIFDRFRQADSSVTR